MWVGGGREWERACAEHECTYSMCVRVCECVSVRVCVSVCAVKIVQGEEIVVWQSKGGGSAYIIRHGGFKGWQEVKPWCVRVHMHMYDIILHYTLVHYSEPVYIVKALLTVSDFWKPT